MKNKDSKPNSIKDYLDLNIDVLESQLSRKNESFWQKAGEQNALRLFHEAAIGVPAYKSFLKSKGIKPGSIKNIKDFAKVPITDKHNYTNKYSLKDRSWNSDLTNSKIIAVSSGTSAEPKYWPRGIGQDTESAIIHELIYKFLFGVSDIKTLVVICFPMGAYISGVATLIPSWLVALKQPITIVSAGNNKSEALRAIRSMSDQFGQVLLVGHPFIIKDIIETGTKEGIKWSKKKIKMMFCSEGFNENWREYILEKAGKSKSSPDAINTYGCSEMLLIGHETKFTIDLKKFFEKNQNISKSIFDQILTPSLFQYNPIYRYIESVGRELVFTSNSGIPLIRYNLKDQGRVVTSLELSKHKEIGNITKDRRWQLPVVALSARSDQTVKFYAANIYPEHVQGGLRKKDFFPKLTGKFTMRKGELKNLDQYLEIHIELRPDTIASKKLHDKIMKEIYNHLKQVNTEFNDMSSKFLDRAVPRIKLWQYQHERYFKPGLKPRYIDKKI